MKTRQMLFALTLALAVAGQAVAVAAGDSAEDTLAEHRMATLDGTVARLSDFRGEIVVVNFWASWCAPCREELPMLGEWHAAWTGRGARVVAISIDKEVAKARRFAEQEKLNMTLMHDGPNGLARSLDVPSMPCTYLLDADGGVVRIVRGSKAKELAALRTEAEALMNARRTAQKAGMTPSSVAPDGGLE